MSASYNVEVPISTQQCPELFILRGNNRGTKCEQETVRSYPKTDLRGIGAGMASEEIFKNFDKLQSMAEKALARLEPPEIPCMEGEQVDATTETAFPAFVEERPVCTALGAVIFPEAISCKLPDDVQSLGFSLQNREVSVDPRRSLQCVRPSFVVPHDVLLQEDPWDSAGGEGVREVEGNSLSRLASKRSPFLSTRKSIGSAENSGSSFVESDKNQSDLSDISWHPGTELSPSSCEYLSHSDTTSSDTDSYSEIEVVLRSPRRRSASPIRRRKVTRSAKKFDRSWGLQTSVIVADPESEEQYLLRKQELQRDHQGICSRRKQVSNMPRTAKGKEKETFEVWRTPKRARKVANKGNPSEVVKSPISKIGQTNKEDNILKPKGMKKTGVLNEVQNLAHEGKHASKLKNANNVPLTENPIEREQVRNKRRKQGTGQRKAAAALLEVETSDAELSDRITPVLKEHEAGGIWKANEGSGDGKGVHLESDVADEDFQQGLGKAKVITPFSGGEYVILSPPVVRHSESKQHRKTITPRWSTSDSEFEVKDRRARRNESTRKLTNRQHKNSGGSSGSQSPQRREKRKSHGRHGRKRIESSPEGRHEHRKHGNKRLQRYSSTDSYGDSEEDLGERRKKPSRQTSPDCRRPLRKQRDFSDDVESSGSSSEGERNGRSLAVVKAEKMKVGSPNDETRKRKERRSRQGERESERRQRERQGLKGHYITVDGQGRPYGFGVGAWKQELNRLCGSLDPSITNIRYQPEEAMATLRRRLKDNFEYSGAVDRAHIRKLAGKALTQRRSRILNSMKDGHDCPAGLNRDVWRRLDRIRQDPHREELSQRMKYANAQRVNKGRTGPRGEHGIREDLFRKLGREPDPAELHLEMRRKKGYEGAAKKRKQRIERTASPASEGVVPLQFDEEKDSKADYDGKAKTLVIGDGRQDSQHLDASVVWRMAKELDELRAAMKASKQMAVVDIGQCSSMPTGGPESPPTLERFNESRSTVKATDKGKGGMPDESVSPPKKKRAARRL